jgi:arylsulfatase A-like enzyme
MMDEARQESRIRFFVQVITAVAAVILTIKLGKIVLNNGLPSLLKENRPEILRAEFRAVILSVLLRVLGMLAVVYLVLGRFFSRKSWRLIATGSPILIFLTYKLIQSFVEHKTVSAQLHGSRSVQGLISELQYLGAHGISLVVLLTSLLWRDLAFLSGFTFIVYCLVMFSPSSYWNTIRVSLIAVVALMFAIAGIELANFLQTGVAGTGQLLGYFLLNSSRGGGSWWSIVRAHINFITTLALVTPFLLGITAAIWRGRSVKLTPMPLYIRAAVLLPTTFGLALLTLCYQPVLSDVRYARQLDDTFLALRDAFYSSSAREVEVLHAASEQPPIFDSSSAVLHATGQSRQEARNVILIMMESAQAKSTTVYDPTLPTTPFLADFAKRGAVVLDMYAVIPRTAAAWISILYGIYPSSNDLIDRWSVVPGGQKRFKSLPKLLSEQGYATGFITATNSDFEHEQALINGFGFQWVQSGNTLARPGLEPVNYDGFEDSIMVEPALSWASQQSAAGHPFFLALMTNVGHDPYSFPASWKKISFGTGNQNYENYLNCMAYIDAVLQDLIQGLERRGLLKSSVVLILGDHGEAFGEHGPRQHILVPYDEALKIPMIIYADGLIPAGSSIVGLRQEPDILPTVLDALGMQGEHLNVPGTSLLKPASADRKLYFSTSFYHGALAMRTGSTKYIYNFDRTPTEVYDIEKDPAEQHDIAETIPDSKRKEAVFDMRVWQERVRRELITIPGTTVGAATPPH